MAALVGHPAVLFVVLLVFSIGAVAFGAHLLRRWAPLPETNREYFAIVQSATLTLLALLVGFSLSMAVGRYDQRKNLEESEANAIGTAYARADLASAVLGARMKDALVRYTKLRLDDYLTREPDDLTRINRDTASIQAELRQMANQVAQERPTPIGALIVAGMSDVLNSQDYSEAARINYIPLGSWFLMVLIAMFGCVVQGYGTKGSLRKGLFVTVLPITVALSLTLIADIDSPRGGIIHVQPQNLTRLMHSLDK
jgi:hypothetical protein